MVADLREAFARDDCRLDDELRLHTARITRLTVHAGALTEASGIHAELERVRRFGADSPDDAIGAAKQLIEATAKLVLLKRNLPVDERQDLPALIKQAQQAPRLHPAAVPPTRNASSPDNADSIKRILGALTPDAIGVAELRNRYGTGHGRLAAPTGLDPRHARFAVGTAATEAGESGIETTQVGYGAAPRCATAAAERRSAAQPGACPSSGDRPAARRAAPQNARDRTAGRAPALA
ncbi:abortive infection family protein (plasmid) [Streptomyces sp. NBC_01007]|nr:abortive infection family protein [Streptomyces sp. NBC_01007]